MSAYEPKGEFKIDKSMLIQLRMTAQMKSAKINLLNYITEIKGFEQEMEIYRTEYFPLLKIKLTDVIVLSSLQLSNL